MNATAERLEIANYYERVYNCKCTLPYIQSSITYYYSMLLVTLSYKLVESMHPDSLEFAYRMARLDQKMNEAATTIVSSWRGYKTRQSMKKILQARKSALLLIQAMIKRRIMKKAR